MGKKYEFFNPKIGTLKIRLLPNKDGVIYTYKNHHNGTVKSGECPFFEKKKQKKSRFEMLEV